MKTSSQYHTAAAGNVTLQTVTNSTATVAAASSSTWFACKVDNTANAAEPVWVKFYDDASPTVGTDGAAIILKLPAGVARTFILMQGNITFGTALSFACTKTSGGVSGTADPDSGVKVALAHT